MLKNKNNFEIINSLFHCSAKNFSEHPRSFSFSINPLAYTDVPETAGLARSINTQPTVRRNSETNPTSQQNTGMY